MEVTNVIIHQLGRAGMYCRSLPFFSPLWYKIINVTERRYYMSLGFRVKVMYQRITADLNGHIAYSRDEPLL